MTEVLREGIGMDGLGLFCMAARACWTASCLTSVVSRVEDTREEEKETGEQ